MPKHSYEPTAIRKEGLKNKKLSSFDDRKPGKGVEIGESPRREVDGGVGIKDIPLANDNYAKEKLAEWRKAGV